MLFGENPKKMFNIICEFMAEINHISAEKTELKTLDDLFHVANLTIIAEGFILKANFQEEQLFNLLSDAYNKKNGIANFILLTKTLEREKQLGFKNLALIVQNKTKKALLVK